MTKKFTRILCLMLCTTLIFAACGTSSTPSSTSTSTTTSSSAVISQASSSAASSAAEAPNETSSSSVYNVKEVSPNRDTTLMRFAMTGDCVSMDPGLYDNSWWKICAVPIYETLLRIDPVDNLILNPTLALSYEWANDNTTVIFEIKQGVKFHDGSIMTAEDVAFSLNRSMVQPANSAMSSMMMDAEVIDDTHVGLNLKYPYLPVLNIMAYPTWSILSKAYTEKCEAENINMGIAPIGTGPFYCDSFRSGVGVTYKRFDDYHGEPPKYETLQIDIFSDQSSACIAAEAGDYEIMCSLSPLDAERMRKNNDWNVLVAPSTSWYYVGTNMTKEPFMDNLDLRLAVAHAIDTEGVAAYRWDHTPIKVPACRGIFGYLDDFEPIYQDQEKSKELLASAGYPNGINLKYYTTTNSWFVDPATVVQAQLKEVGINADLQILERGVYMDQCADRLDYELVYWAFGCAYPDVDVIAWARFHSSCVGGNLNVCGISDPAIDDLLYKARTSLDAEERLGLYRELFTINRDNAWYIPTSNGLENILVSAEIKGAYPQGNCLWYTGDYYY